MTSSDVAQTHLAYTGLSAEEVKQSRKQHGANTLTPPKRDPWWRLYLKNFDDPVIRILIIAAIIALAAGAAEGNYIEGLGILIAIFLATTLAFLNEFKANREFDILNQVNDEIPIKTIREGHFIEVPLKDLVVGDIISVETGEETPADGEVLESVSMEVDESRLTGESLPVHKHPAKKQQGDSAQAGSGEATYPPDRVLRGTMVVDGHGILRLTSVGDHTEIGKTARSAAEEVDEQTPLNRQLEKLSKVIGVVGFLVAAGTFAALVVRGVAQQEIILNSQQWFCSAVIGLGAIVALTKVWLPILFDAFELAGWEISPPNWFEESDLKGWGITLVVGAVIIAVGAGVGAITGLMPQGEDQWNQLSAAGREFLVFFMIAVTLIVVAVPEGLAMSVTLSLAYSMRKMTAANNLVRRMHACETIGAATVICSDKTGTLTLNEMRVGQPVFPHLGESPLEGKTEHSPGEDLLIEAISVNSTAQLSQEEDGGDTKPLGNPTEGALLLWLAEHGVDYAPVRQDFPVVHQWTFTTERKYMATVGETQTQNKGLILHVKGAPEIVLERCANIAGGEGSRPLTDDDRTSLLDQLQSQQKRGMRTLGFAFRGLQQSDLPEHLEETEADEVAKDLTWLGFTAIADPVRPEVPPAVQACRDAGVKVKMVTGDVSNTALEIARQINLWKDGEDGEKEHFTGRQFAELADEQAAQAVEDMKVLSRARPADKMRLVRLLKDRGEVVAVTGDGTNDAPALNHADVGLAMGKTGTAVAKEASDIILLDDSFSSIVNAIQWGRSLYENIQRFILFQLTINVAALAIVLLGPFIDVKFPLTVVQMLWVNLIMDTFAALALATEPPHPHVMHRPPRDPQAFIVTPPMAKNIFGVAGVFLVVMLALILVMNPPPWFLDALPGELVEGNRLALPDWLEGDDPEDPAQQLAIHPRDATRGGTIFFSIFVLLQFWNLFNARCMGSNRSAFWGLMENKAFLVIATAILLGQIALVTFLQKVFRTTPLELVEWLVILAITSPVLWVGELFRLIDRKRTADQPINEPVTGELKGAES